MLKQPGNDPWIQAQIHRGLGEALTSLGEFAKAKPELELALQSLQGLDDAVGVATVHEDLGLLARNTGDNASAISYFDQSLAEFTALGDQHKSLAVQVHQLYLSGAKGTRETTGKLLGMAESLGDKRAMGRLLHYQGDGYFARGEYDAAAKSYEKAIGTLEEIGDKFDLATVFVSMGRLEKAHGNARQARSEYRKALKLQRETEDTTGEIQTINAIAVAYEDEDDVRASLTYYRKALAMAEAIKSPRYILFERGNLATEYMVAGQFTRALPLLQKVIAAETSPYLSAYRFKALSKCYFGLGDNPHALEAAEKAIVLGRDHVEQGFIADALIQRARVYSSLGDAEKALTDSQDALRILETIRSRLVPKDYLKQGFSDSQQDLYDVAIKLRFSQGDFKGAAEAAEEARARAFLDLMATRQSTNATPPTASRAAVIDRKSIFDSTASANAFGAEEMFATARRLHSTLLSYWVGDNDLFIMVAGQDAVMRGVKVRIGRKKLQMLVAAAQSTTGRIGASEVTKGKRDVWGQLYDYLLNPIRNYLPTERSALLTIVPHGPLFGLPFAALRDPKGNYLVERYATHYVPAAAVLKFTDENENRAKMNAMKYLLVASTASRQIDGKSLAPLSSAISEIDSIRKITGDDNSVVLEDDSARVGAVSDAMKSARVVHVAAHAIVDNGNPLSSFVALAGDPGSSDPEIMMGKLSASKIYDLEIPAELVVLSACDSGLGRVGGDGVIGLSRAFFSAGAASVIASLWDVPDVPTSFTMREFYRESSANHNKSSALRNAQLKLIRALRSGKLSMKSAIGNLSLSEDPHLWAGFVLEGNP